MRHEPYDVFDKMTLDVERIDVVWEKAYESCDFLGMVVSSLGSVDLSLWLVENMVLLKDTPVTVDASMKRKLPPEGEEVERLAERSASSYSVLQ